MPGNAAGAEAGDRPAFEAAAAGLRRGGAVVLPTDTVYGVAVLLSTADATQTLSRLKARSSEQPLAVLVASAEQAHSLIEKPSASAERLMSVFWPGPLTIVLRRRPALSGLALGGDGSNIGVRCPAHALVRELAGRLGPIVTTSANRHGEATPATAAEAAGTLSGDVAAVVDGGVLAGLPSTVVDCTTEPPTVLREGAVRAADVRSVVESGA